MKDVEKSRTSFISVNLRVLREKHLFQCPPFRPGVSYVFGFRLVLEIPLDTKARVAHETLVAGEVV